MDDNTLNFNEYIEQIYMESVREACERFDDYSLLDKYNKYMELKDKDNLTNEDKLFIEECSNNLNKAYNGYLKSIESNKRYEESVSNGGTFKRRYEWIDKRLEDESK